MEQIILLVKTDLPADKQEMAEDTKGQLVVEEGVAPQVVWLRLLM